MRQAPDTVESDRPFSDHRETIVAVVLDLNVQRENVDQFAGLL